jgi:hypothetical protein
MDDRHVAQSTLYGAALAPEAARRWTQFCGTHTIDEGREYAWSTCPPPCLLFTSFYPAKFLHRPSFSAPLPSFISLYPTYERFHPFCITHPSFLVRQCPDKFEGPNLNYAEGEYPQCRTLISCSNEETTQERGRRSPPSGAVQ